MYRSIAWIVMVVGLFPSVAGAKTLCVQFDSNGDVLVLKGIGRGSKAVSAYLADYQTGEDYDFKPMQGSALLSSANQLVAGLTEHGVSMTSATGNSFDGTTRFHRLRCGPGSDGKLGELDTCSDTHWTIPSNVQFTNNGHIISCIPQLLIP